MQTVGKLHKLAEFVHVKEELVRGHFSYHMSVRCHMEFTKRKGNVTVLLPYVKKRQKSTDKALRK